MAQDAHTLFIDGQRVTATHLQHLQDRLREATKHGFERVILPKANAPKRAPKGVRVQPVERLSEALAALWE